MAASKALAKELRKSHFNFGYMATQSATTYNDYYVAHQPESAATRTINGPALRKCHFVLGTDPQQKDTSYSRDYSEKKGEPVSLNKSVLDDLRATHYELGHFKPDFTSIQSQSYVQPPAPQREPGGHVRERPHDNAFFDVNKSYAHDNSAASPAKPYQRQCGRQSLSKSFVEPRY